MADVPSWLNEENISAAGKVATANPVATKAVASRLAPPPPPTKAESSSMFADTNTADVETGRSASTTNPSSEFIIEEETLKAMQKWHLALRVTYMGASIFMAAAAAISLSNQKDLGLIFFALYVLFFSAMICCFEFNLQVRFCYAF